MSANNLLILLKELRKRDKMRDLPIQVYKSTNVRFYLSYDIKAA